MYCFIPIYSSFTLFHVFDFPFMNLKTTSFFLSLNIVSSPAFNELFQEMIHQILVNEDSCLKLIVRMYCIFVQLYAQSQFYL